MKETDRNFDELAGRFGRNIYGTAKGQIRLAVLWEHLLRHHPPLEHGRPLRILDAGCGMGQLAVRLAGLGHKMVLCDISEDLLGQARALFQQERLSHQAEFHHASLQEMSAAHLPPFDLVLFHAVMEWLGEPQAALAQITALLKPGGHLSLMFYNVNSLIMRNLVRGNLYKVDSGRYAGDPNSLTPQHPLQPQAVFEWLEAAGYEVRAKAGIRVFHDYMERGARERLPLEAMVEMETRFAEQEPYLSLGRYIHVLAQLRQA